MSTKKIIYKVAIILYMNSIIINQVSAQEKSFDRQQQTTMNTIKSLYESLKKINYLSAKEIDSDYQHWLSTLELCNNAECVNEVLAKKQNNINHLKATFNSDFQLYSPKYFSQYVGREDRYYFFGNKNEVYDRATGLIWEKCLHGSSWKNNGCIYSNRKVFSPSEFQKTDNPGEWRAPTIFELITLIDFKLTGPTINNIAFPNQYSGFIGTGSAYAGNFKNGQWVVNFAEGETGWVPLSNIGFRLIREFNLIELENLEHNQHTDPRLRISKPSFSCQQRLNEVEKSICKSPKLSAHDINLMALYNALLKLPMINGKQLRAYQLEWIKARNTCKEKLCVEKYYTEKLAELKSISDMLTNNEQNSSITNISMLMRRKNRFIQNGEFIDDTATQLSWKRCIEGLHWTGIDCSGLPEMYSKQNAISIFHDGQSKWRLPKLIELASIINFEKTMPAIDTTIFPEISRESLNTTLHNRYGGDYSKYPSLDREFISTDIEWNIDFQRGYVSKRTSEGLIRLVADKK